MIQNLGIVIQKDEEGYYVASVPALRGCHTQARSLGQLMERLREAIEVCDERCELSAGKQEVAGGPGGPAQLAVEGR
jgi:predicted RNase H-like HicB family nuclease